MSTKPKVKRFENVQDLCIAIQQFETPRISLVDNGIGVYEYWGFKGVDHQYDGELEELPPITLELFIPKGYTLYMQHFDTFISDIITEIEEASHTIEMIAKDRVSIDAEEYGKKDYSDVIKLCHQTQIHTYSCSTEIWKLVFVFTWEDGRN